jgi:hypothetical protein
MSYYSKGLTVSSPDDSLICRETGKVPCGQIQLGDYVANRDLTFVPDPSLLSARMHVAEVARF